jgi:cytochrome c5
MSCSRALAALCAATTMAACGRGSDVATNHPAGSLPTADSVPYVPTSGFTSAQGTPVSNPAPAIAPESAAARLAPPPSTALDAAISAEEQAAIQRAPAGDGHDLLLGNCLICHSAAMVEQQHKDTAGWNKTVTQMMKWGSPLPAAQKPVLIAYLAQHYGARAPQVTASATPP